MSLATPTKGKMCGLIFGEERLLLQIEVIMLFQHKKQYLILVLTDGRYPVAGLSPNGMVMDHILQKDVIIIPWGGITKCTYTSYETFRFTSSVYQTDQAAGYVCGNKGNDTSNRSWNRARGMLIRSVEDQSVADYRKYLP